MIEKISHRVLAFQLGDLLTGTTSDLWAERNTSYMKIMPKLFDSTTSSAGNWRHLREFESGDSADRESWDMAVEYVHEFSADWRVEREGVFVKRQTGNEEDMDFAEANGGSHHPMMMPLFHGHNNDADHVEAGVLGEGDDDPGPIFL